MSMFRSPIWAALAGYLFTFYNSKKTDERKAQIDRINEQVKGLYGPLLACITATASAYQAMVKQHSPDGTTASLTKAVREDPDGQVGQIYRKWMKEVLQPLNEKAASIIIENVNLLEGTTIDPLMLQFVAHVFAYKVIIQRWEEGATGEWSAIQFPDDLLPSVKKSFKRIKRKQAELLGMKGEEEEGGGERMDDVWDDGDGVPLRSKL